MKKKVVYPEAESLSLDALKLELKKVRRNLRSSKRIAGFQNSLPFAGKHYRDFRQNYA